MRLFISFILIILFTETIYSNKKIAIINSFKLTPYIQSIDIIKKEVLKKNKTTFFNFLNQNIKENFLIIKNINPDVILAIGTEATITCIKNAPNIPIIYTMILDPYRTMVSESFNNKKINITGVPITVNIETEFKIFKRLFPHAKNIGFITSSKNYKYLQTLKDLGKVNGCEIFSIFISDNANLKLLTEKVLNNSDVLWADIDSNIYNSSTVNYFIESTNKKQIPFYTFSKHFVKAGALYNIETNYENIAIMTANKILEVLKNKNKKFQKKVIYPNSYKIYINKNTANNLMIKIPKSLKDKLIFIK